MEIFKHVINIDSVIMVFVLISSILIYSQISWKHIIWKRNSLCPDWLETRGLWSYYLDTPDIWTDWLET